MYERWFDGLGLQMQRRFERSYRLGIALALLLLAVLIVWGLATRPERWPVIGELYAALSEVASE